MVECMKADPQLFWSIALSILSVILVIVSVVVSIATLRQNSKMIESSARPYIGVSSLQVNNGSPFFLISVRNYGASAGLINGFSCGKPLGDYCLGDRGLPLLEGIEGTTLMPGQKIVCAMDTRSSGPMPLAPCRSPFDTLSAGRSMKTSASSAFR